MYNVRVMKRVTASDARRNWFRLLDEVAGGEVVEIERNGKRIVLRREDRKSRSKRTPDYSGLITVPDLDQLEDWTWEWDPDEGLRFVGVTD